MRFVAFLACLKDVYLGLKCPVCVEMEGIRCFRFSFCCYVLIEPLVIMPIAGRIVSSSLSASLSRLQLSITFTL